VWWNLLEEGAGLTHDARVGEREKRAESREQRGESREERAESREQRAESRAQRAESKEQKAESRDHVCGWTCSKRALERRTMRVLAWAMTKGEI
jgi:uncharacterized protein (DUF3084 family)